MNRAQILTLFVLSVLVTGCHGTTNRFTPTTSGDFVDLVVSGSYAFAIQRSFGMHIVDVSDPSQAHEVGSFQSGDVTHVKIVDNLAFLAGSRPCLQIVDVSNPRSPKSVGQIDPTGLICNGADLAVDGHLVYFSAGIEGIFIFDVSDPRTPVRLGNFKSNSFLSDTHVAVAGDKLYVAGSSDFQVLDVSDPMAPVALSSSLDVGSNPLALVVQGPRAYVADSFGGLRILDVTTPASPRILTDYKPSILGADVIVAPNGSIWYGDYDGLHQLDLTDLAHPKDQRFVAIHSVNRIAVQGPHAYVAGSTSIVILDL